MTRKNVIELGDCTHDNLKQLKKINSVVFPVTYHDKFDLDVPDSGDLCKLAYCNDIIVGAVCCRIEKGVDSNMRTRRQLYIMTLGCLSPYRRLGIGTVMLEHILKIVEEDGYIDNIFL